MTKFLGVNKPYAGGRFALELDGRQIVGFVSAIDGGHFKSDPVTSIMGGLPKRQGGDILVGRYPGKPKFEDISLTVGMAMSPAFWKWVSATINNKPERRDGALVGYDFNLKERSRRTFKRALISEVQFPALDAAAKQSATVTVKISPENLEYSVGDGSTLRYEQAQNEIQKQKLWLSQNFRFTLDRFGNSDALRNAKLESFSVKQNVITNPVGTELVARKEPGRVELPQLQVTFPESYLGDWMKWWEESVRGYQSTKETTGHITYLASDFATELMRLDLSGVGLTSLEVEKYEASKEGIAKVKATLYIEGMKLAAGKGNPA